MNLDLARAHVLATLDAHEEAFRRSRDTQPELVRFTSVTDLIESLMEAPSEENADHGRVLLGVLAEYQRSWHRLWSGALFVAFVPMVGKIRRRLHVPAGFEDDAVSTILDAFFAEIARVKVDGFGTLAVLRRAVELTTFRAARRWRLHASAAATPINADAMAVATPDLDLAIDLLRRPTSFTEAEGVRPRLRTTVELTHHEATDVERRRIYERLKKRRTRERARNPEAFALAA